MCGARLGFRDFRLGVEVAFCQAPVMRRLWWFLGIGLIVATATSLALGRILRCAQVGLPRAGVRVLDHSRL